MKFLYPIPDEQIYYEEAAARDDHGRPMLLSIINFERSNKSYVRESHVFLPSSGRHLHEISHGVWSDNPEYAMLQSVHHTRRLLDEQEIGVFCSSRLNDFSLGAVAERLPEHMFFRLSLMSRFRDIFWEIQDWTTSSTLRGLLARITSYRSDPQEVSSLTKMFSLTSERKGFYNI